MECEYCKHTFKNKFILNTHQQTAKYCLDLRGVQKTGKFLCTPCETFFTSKASLEKHQYKCLEFQRVLFDIKIEKMEEEHAKELNEKNQHIKELQDTIKNIAIKAVEQPKTVTNNTQNINTVINNLKPIESDHFKRQAENLTIEHVRKGVTGYLDYAKGPFEGYVFCSDYGRRKIKYKDSDGNIITDPEMAQLAPLFFEAIKDKSNELTDDLRIEMTDKFGQEVFDKFTEAMDLNISIEKGAQGIPTDFYHELVKFICAHTIPKEEAVICGL